MRGGIETLARLTGLALLLALPVSTPSRAELYRCQEADGSVRFTNDPAACPGAPVHEPEGEIQRIAPSRPPAAAAPLPRPSASSPEHLEAQEAAWRGKLAQAREERAQLTAEVEHLHEMVGWCNRGGGVARKDESGIWRRSSCKTVRANYERQSARLRQVEAYLAEGIHEECRRAGCLPGWLR